MDYFSVTGNIISLLYGLMGLLTVHFIFFAVAGLFFKKRFPKTDKKLRYAVLISARNEEAVVGNLIQSIRRSDYPQDKIEIFLMAHNCTDNTAAVAREAGAVVYEYNNPNERTKGLALKQLLLRIHEDYGCKHCDGYFVFDADNILEKDFISRMNDAFAANGERHMITSYRNSKNFGYNLMSAMYGLYFAYSSRFESRGRAVMGSSTRVAGTGFLMPAYVMDNGWNYLTLSEDTELTADMLAEDMKVIYCDEAVFYDEQPTDIKTMWNQRLRWAKGHLSVCLTKGGKLLKSLFKSKKKGGGSFKWSIYDLLVGLTPLCVIGTVIGILQNLTFLLAPLFTDSTLMDIYPTYLINSLNTTALTYVMLIFSSSLLYIVEGKRFPKISFGLKVASVLLWPAFLLIAAPLQIIAVFKKKVVWTPIPHKHAIERVVLEKERNTAPLVLEEKKAS